MSELKITLNQARNIDSNLVDSMLQEAEKKLKKSKAKSKGDSTNELQWSVSWCEEISGGVLSFNDLLSGKSKEPTGWGSNEPEDERVASILSRMHTSLHCNMVGANAYRNLNEVPAILEQKIRKDVQEEIKEQSRVANLSDEDRQKEIEQLLGELQGPGFFGVKL